MAMWTLAWSVGFISIVVGCLSLYLRSFEPMRPAYLANGLEIREASPEIIRVSRMVAKPSRHLPSAYYPLNRNTATLTLRYAILADDMDQRLVGRTRRDGVSVADAARDGESAVKAVELDQETRAWVEDCFNNPIPTWRHRLWKKLRYKMYNYDAGVILRVPTVYLLSPSHWQELLRGHTGPGTKAIDVGAGRGDLTSAYKNHFGEMWATEISNLLVWNLRYIVGVKTVQTNAISFERLGATDPFDVVFCLNVLDRCKDPFVLIDQMLSIARPGGLFVVALPLPFKQRDARLGDGESQNIVNVRGKTWEAAASNLILEVFEPRGLELTRLVRVPYYCSGAIGNPVSVLDGAVFVFRVLEDRPPIR